MSDPAVIAALPDHLRVLQEQVEAHAPVYAPTAALRWTLVTLLGACEFAARQFVTLTPGIPQVVPAVEPRGPQQFHAPLGDRTPVVEDPLVPRRAGEDHRLPPGRYHP